MSAIKGKNTKPEMLVRSYLHRNGLRFRLHSKDLPGRPDLVLAKRRTVVLVHGCFWHSHGCANSVVPKTRRKFWVEKLDANAIRDEMAKIALKKLGWRVVVIWECDLRSQPARTLDRLSTTLLRR